MKPEAQREAIAKYCGWPQDSLHARTCLESLDAMHAAEELLKPHRCKLDGDTQWEKYFLRNICQLAELRSLSVGHLPASLKAEAFLKSLKLWEEEPKRAIKTKP